MCKRKLSNCRKPFDCPYLHERIDFMMNLTHEDLARRQDSLANLVCSDIDRQFFKCNTLIITVTPYHKQIIFETGPCYGMESVEPAIHAN